MDKVDRTRFSIFIFTFLVVGVVILPQFLVSSLVPVFSDESIIENESSPSLVKIVRQKQTT